MRIKVGQKKTALELILAKNLGMSNNKAKKIIKTSTFLVDGVAVATTPLTFFEAGQEVEIIRDTKTNFKHEHPQKDRPVVIKFEDEYYIVAIKPVGMLSCRNETQLGNSFDQVLKEYVSKRDNENVRLWIAHRIDREVEGLIIFAKSEELQHLIKDNWQSVTKKYLALTENTPNPENGIIENWLKEGFKYKMMVHQKEVPGSLKAKTEYKLVKKVGKYSLVEVTLHSGRKNQIRAHLSSINCPIVGDYKYGADSSVVRQIRLVANYLEFTHPVTKRKIQLEYSPKANFFKPSQEKDEKYK